MCGIAGFIGKKTGEVDDIVSSMLIALDHRGPDDHGYRTWNVEPNAVTLGNTRLSILDLSPAGHQPMTEESGRYWIVFNGEIYNFKELRKLLDPDGTLFRSGTDTEAILYAYRRWGVEAFNTFRGMYAFALFDTVERIVHLGRDPLGLKPLYYSATGRALPC